jgi:hypothetical protein
MRQRSVGNSRTWSGRLERRRSGRALATLGLCKAVVRAGAWTDDGGRAVALDPVVDHLEQVFSIYLVGHPVEVIESVSDVADRDADGLDFWALEQKPKGREEASCPRHQRRSRTA